MIFVDTNVILDVLQDDPHWADWSVDQLSEAGQRGPVIVNAVVVAELSRDYATLAELHRAITPFALSIEPLSDAAGFVAGHRFVAARRDKPQAPKRPLPDFFIAAHALTLDATLLTRDPSLYRRYFPDLPLITPETQP